MDTIFHLNWIRESANGHLDSDLGTAVPAPDLELALIGLLPEQQPGKIGCNVTFADLHTPSRLPEWARRNAHIFFDGNPEPSQLSLVQSLCNRIRDKAWNARQSDLFLPFFGRREWSERFAVLPELGFEREADRVIATGVNPNSVRELAMRTAAGVLTRSHKSVPVHFECNLPMIEPWRDLLLERYGLELPEGAPPLARLTINTSGEELSCWPHTPRERHCHYYDVFSPMALTVQRALRRWTLASFALGPEELANFYIGGDLLVYSAVRLHADKRARDYSYDVFNVQMMDLAFGRSARRLEPMLKSAHKTLLRAGREDDANSYLKRDLRVYANRLAQRARRRKRVRTMLVSEGVLIYSLMKFAKALKSLDSARAVVGAVDSLAADFEDRIRKMFFFLPETDHLGTLIFLEASNAIQQAMGGKQALQVECETADGARYTARRPMEDSCASL